MGPPPSNIGSQQHHCDQHPRPRPRQRPQIGDRVIITCKGLSTAEEELNGRHGTVTGSQDMSNGRYPVCLEPTNAYEGQIVAVLARNMIKERPRGNVANGSSPPKNLSTYPPSPNDVPLPSTNAVRVNVQELPVVEATAAEAAPACIVIHKTSDDDRIGQRQEAVLNNTVIVRGHKRNCCYTTCSVLFAVLGVVACVFGFMSLGLLWWLWIVGVVLLILSCVFCGLNCCDSNG
mmetsp:Transcript_20956/g.42775  ORF Transcript_20956/g.42775 Transcript_20956/m.42775 type:complete len:233 (-) Transcript_20956:2444-3142(-)